MVSSQRLINYLTFEVKWIKKSSFTHADSSIVKAEKKFEFTPQKSTDDKNSEDILYTVE